MTDTALIATDQDLLSKAEAMLADNKTYVHIIMRKIDGLTRSLTTEAVYRLNVMDVSVSNNYWQAYNNIIAAWDDLDIDDPEWAKQFPYLFRAWNHARYCVREQTDIGLYPDVFQDYCSRGCIGKIGYQEAHNLLQQRMALSMPNGTADDSIANLKKLRDYRVAIRRLVEEIGKLNIEQKPRIIAVYKKLLDQFAYELMFAAPDY